MNQLDLKRRVATVTGGARGIGFATAERMLIAGAEVSLWDIDSKALQRFPLKLHRILRLRSSWRIRWA